MERALGGTAPHMHRVLGWRGPVPLALKWTMSGGVLAGFDALLAGWDGKRLLPRAVVVERLSPLAKTGPSSFPIADGGTREQARVSMF